MNPPATTTYRPYLDPAHFRVPPPSPTYLVGVVPDPEDGAVHVVAVDLVAVREEAVRRRQHVVPGRWKQGVNKQRQEEEAGRRGVSQGEARRRSGHT